VDKLDNLNEPGKSVMKLAKKPELVVISNALARGFWKYKSTWEGRIVALVASKVQPSDEDFREYRIPISELGLDMQHFSGDQYRQIREALFRLRKEDVLIEGEGRNFRAYGIFSLVGYENGYLIAKFDPDLKPHFLKLRANFTTYQLNEYFGLRSTYSQKMFNYLKSWASLGTVTVNLEDLQQLLGTADSLKQFGQFRRAILEQAYADINAKTTISFTWEAIKKKNKVTGVIFKITRQTLRDKEVDPLAKHKSLQKRSNTCYEANRKHQTACSPNRKLEKCRFCLTRGRMAGQSLLEKREDL
jgi:plasmid replication initiation protein